MTIVDVVAIKTAHSIARYLVSKSFVDEYTRVTGNRTAMIKMLTKRLIPEIKNFAVKHKYMLFTLFMFYVHYDKSIHKILKDLIKPGL